MRLTGIQKNLYLLVSSRPGINRALLQLHRSFEEVRHLLEKDYQKSEKILKK